MIHTTNFATLAIKNQLGDYKDKSKNLLIIGGIVVAAYAFSKIFMDDEKEESIEKEPKKENEKEPAPIQAGSFFC